jgi:hypothetical protein
MEPMLKWFCPGQSRLLRYINEFAGFLEANCTHLRALSIGDFEAITCSRYSVLNSVIVNQGGAPGDFIPRSRDTCKVGA